jgi:protein ImuB
MMVSSARRTINSKRILALWFPRLPTDRIRRRAHSAQSNQAREKSALRLEAPLIVAAKSGNALHLSAVDDKAERLGLKEGMPLADARAMIRALRVVEADEAADAKLLEAIADWCERFTPVVALDGRDGLLLDITGAAHLFGGERALLDHARQALAAQGFAVHGAVAGTAMAARALAHYADGTIAQPGQETQAVAGLPIEALMLGPAATHGLRRAGLKTIGQVAARARAELAERFGIGLLSALDRALGRAEDPISPRRVLPEIMAERRFAEPVTDEETIFDVVLSLSTALAEAMEKRATGARQIEAVFFRSDGMVRRIAVMTASPQRDPQIIQKLFRERIGALSDPLESGFGFDLIRLEISQAEAIRPEAIGFESNETEKEIGFLIDRLAARFGTHRVLCFQPRDTHIPEASAAVVPAQFAGPTKLTWQALREADEAPRRPLRLLARPEPIDVMAEVPDGPPARFRWRRVLHTVAHAEGPERIAMEWWRSQNAQGTRDYFRIEDDDGRRFWLYRDGLYGRETGQPNWYVHGLFS